MGVTNFCKLLDPILPPTTTPDPFDSILVDVQSYLYVAIEYSLEISEVSLLRDVCKNTWSQLSKTLNSLLNHATEKSVTLVLSFDGDGVPMKWPTQRKRRAKDHTVQGKNIYRYALFGVNKISLQVQQFIVDQFKHYEFPKIQRLRILICGCNVPGEGEHKMFQVAEKIPGCERPIVVSVDQDVFVLAFMRVDRYDAIQVFRYERYYHVTRLVKKKLLYPISRLVTATFLFGNDFIPPLVTISPINAPFIHKSLDFESLEKNSSSFSSLSDSETLNISEKELCDESNNPAAVLAHCIQKLKAKLRFERAAYVDPQMVVHFWITTLWCRDYYTKREFPQKYLENPIYDAFDRNQLLTGLSDVHFSTCQWLQAKDLYEATVTHFPETSASQTVFANDSILEKLKPFWTVPENTNCVKLNLTKRRRMLPKNVPSSCV